MIVISRQYMADRAAEGWARQYPAGVMSGKLLDGLAYEEIGRRLKELGPNPNPAYVDRIIGNLSWTTVPSCSECDSRPDAVVLVGQDLDEESWSAYLCIECAEKARQLLTLRKRPAMSQPDPVPNSSRPIHELVCEDVMKRLEKGIKTYGVPLQAHNGRDALWDAYEEALDLAAYLRQKIEENRTAQESR